MTLKPTTRTSTPALQISRTYSLNRPVDPTERRAWDKFTTQVFQWPGVTEYITELTKDQVTQWQTYRGVKLAKYQAEEAAEEAKQAKRERENRNSEKKN